MIKRRIVRRGFIDRSHDDAERQFRIKAFEEARRRRIGNGSNIKAFGTADSVLDVIEQIRKIKENERGRK